MDSLTKKLAEALEDTLMLIQGFNIERINDGIITNAENTLKEYRKAVEDEK